MTMIKDFKKRSETVFAIILITVSLILFVIPTGFQRSIYVNAQGARARVLATDDSHIIQTGLFRQGDQSCTVEILSGDHKGQVLEGVNMLSGSLASDKVFQEGDLAWVLVERDTSGRPVFVNMIDYYRLSKEAAAAAVFALILIAFARFSGVRIIASFIFAFLVIWKLLIPAALHGINPLFICLAALMMITVATLLLVGGVSRRSFAAICGAVSASLVTALTGFVMTHWMRIHGSVLEQSESLLYSGFQNLDLTSLFVGVVALSAGGAIMDLSIDVAVAMAEVREHAPSISRKELIQSGMAVGRAGVGTQTTTLLLAYMGSWLTVMMVYMAQSTPVLNIMTGKMIASEIVQTLTGCTGLVLVTPLTSLIASYLYSPKVDKTSLKNRTESANM